MRISQAALNTVNVLLPFEACLVKRMTENGILGPAEQIMLGLGLKGKDVRTLPGLTLAYLGDCIYELVIRTMLVEQGMMHVSELNKVASSFAKASAQCAMFRAVEDKLSEEEMAAFKRGRNVKSSSTAKNATVADYRVATGYEALLGYLYLLNRFDRVLELVKLGVEAREKKDT